MSLLTAYLERLLESGGSDLHLLAAAPPRTRVHGELVPLEQRPLAPEALRGALLEIMPPDGVQSFERSQAADFAHTVPGLARFRVNVFAHLYGMGAVFRAIPSEAKGLEDLGMPAAVHNLVRHTNGLILVTGKTGSGKSTTLAAMVDAINRSIRGHILTIEDPIEFIHRRKNCLISQRQVGLHAGSFASALHSALREDPDVILIGEMRDLETISIAVTAAETGILVMGTLHTSGAAATVDRIVSAFPADKRSHMRTMLSTSLRGVVSQQLVARREGGGRVAALEILINTPAVGNLIRQGRIDQLETTMQSSRALGMQTMDGSLRELLKRGAIRGRDAYLHAIHKPDFEGERDGE